MQHGTFTVHHSGLSDAIESIILGYVAVSASHTIKTIDSGDSFIGKAEVPCCTHEAIGSPMGQLHTDITFLFFIRKHP